jgi:hypothetical protein
MIKIGVETKTFAYIKDSDTKIGEPYSEIWKRE